MQWIKPSEQFDATCMSLSVAAELLGAGGRHHLADVIEANWRSPIVIKPTIQPEPNDWQILAGRLLEFPQILLGCRERDFLENMRRSKIPPTDKQWKWLGDIEARLPSSELRMAS